MFRAVILFLISLSLIACSGKEKKFNEKHYQTEFCDELGGEMEVVLKDSRRSLKVHLTQDIRPDRTARKPMQEMI